MAGCSEAGAEAGSGGRLYRRCRQGAAASQRPSISHPERTLHPYQCKCGFLVCLIILSGAHRRPSRWPRGPRGQEACAAANGPLALARLECQLGTCGDECCLHTAAVAGETFTGDLREAQKTSGNASGSCCRGAVRSRNGEGWCGDGSRPDDAARRSRSCPPGRLPARQVHLTPLHRSAWPVRLQCLDNTTILQNGVWWQARQNGRGGY